MLAGLGISSMVSHLCGLLDPKAVMGTPPDRGEPSHFVSAQILAPLGLALCLFETSAFSLVLAVLSIVSKTQQLTWEKALLA